MARIICLDDDRDCLAILSQMLKVADHDVFPLLRADRLSEAINEIHPDLIVTDLMMPGVSGGMVYHKIRTEFGPGMPILVSSGSSLRLKLPDDPLLDYCPKPVGMAVLHAKVNDLLARPKPISLTR